MHMELSIEPLRLKRQNAALAQQRALIATEVGDISKTWQLAASQRGRTVTVTVRIMDISKHSQCHLLNKVKTTIKNRGRNMLSKGIFFCPHNACPHAATTCKDLLQRSWNNPHIAVISYRTFTIMSLENSKKLLLGGNSQTINMSVEEWVYIQRWTLIDQGFHILDDHQDTHLC